MSTFEDDQYHWRETYFVLFDPKRRPRLEFVREQLLKRFPSLIIRSEQANSQGQLEMLSLQSPEDSSAVDLVYQEGEQVLLEIAAIADDLEQSNKSPKKRKKLDEARKCSARLDLLHFERLEEKTLLEEKTRLEETASKTEEGPSCFPPLLEQTSKESAVPQKIRPRNPFANRPQFHFDPNCPDETDQSGNECSFSDWVDTGFDTRIHTGLETDAWDDDNWEEPLDPNTLIGTLQLLRELTKGVAIDPGSGILL
ncbi:MAG: hypothetical protein ACRC10_04570 [Thermoguttaceae bacterium]